MQFGMEILSQVFNVFADVFEEYLLILRILESMHLLEYSMLILLMHL